MTKEELYSNLSKDMADYCIARMKPYTDNSGQTITGFHLSFIFKFFNINLKCLTFMNYLSIFFRGGGTISNRTFALLVADRRSSDRHHGSNLVTSPTQGLKALICKGS